MLRRFLIISKEHAFRLLDPSLSSLPIINSSWSVIFLHDLCLFLIENSYFSWKLQMHGVSVHSHFRLSGGLKNEMSIILFSPMKP